MDYNWDFSSILLYKQLFWIGLQNTVILGSVGLFVGAARFSGKLWLYYPATVFVEVFRNTPVLVQIMWFFFAFPIIAPFRIDAFTAASLGLTLNTIAFSSEIYRAGLQSIAKGQWEAGKALGMSYSEQMRRVILPQSIRRMLPAFMNRAVELFKMTSLASVIAYGELVYQAKVISTIEFNPIETYTTVALVFFAVLFPMTIIVRRFETNNSVGR